MIGGKLKISAKDLHTIKFHIFVGVPEISWSEFEENLYCW